MSNRIKLRTYLYWQAMIGRIEGTSTDVGELVDGVVAEIAEAGYDIHQTMSWEQWQEQDFGLEGSEA